jgi:protein tyrosine phosphatase
MANSRVNNSQTTKTQNISKEYNKPLPETPKSLFAKFKISVIERTKTWLSKTVGSLFSFIKSDGKKIHNRNITKSKQKNKYTKDTKVQHQSKTTVDPYKTESLDEIYGTLHDFIGTPNPEEEIYMNLQDVQAQGEVIYENVKGVQQLKKEQAFGSIDSCMKALGECLQSGKHELTKSASVETDTWFKSIRGKAKQFNPTELVPANKAHNKYRAIGCPIHSSATKHNIYHANKITIGESSYIAAQGPYTEGDDIAIAGDFIAMIAENDSPISISLNEKIEFFSNSNVRKNKMLPPQKIGETINIPTKTENGETIREATTITMMNSIKDSNNGLQVDVLSINGKQHVRIYDLNWKDHTGGDPERIAAISLFVEQLGYLPELKDRKDKPTIINCNAGVGRTGTTILANHMIKEIKQGKMLSESKLEKDILYIRNNRPSLVQDVTQLETLKKFVAQGNDFVSNMEGYFKS